MNKNNRKHSIKQIKNNFKKHNGAGKINYSGRWQNIINYCGVEKKIEGSLK